MERARYHQTTRPNDVCRYGYRLYRARIYLTRITLGETWAFFVVIFCDDDTLGRRRLGGI